MQAVKGLFQNTARFVLKVRRAKQLESKTG